MKTLTSQISTLSHEQADFFRNNGYLHMPGFIDQNMVKDVLCAIQEVEQKLLLSGAKIVNGIPLKFGKDFNGKTIIQRMTFASLYHPLLHQLLMDPRFNDLLPLLGQQGRIGENEKDGMVVNHYVNVEGSQFAQMGWHTDALRDIFYGHHVMPMLNVGVHLNDYPASRGGLRVIPGTHQQGLFKMLFYKKYFRDNNPDPAEVAFDISAGDLTIHDGRLWHRVARSTVTGEVSRRRVIYIPFVTGKYHPKSDKSKTPLYFKVQHLAKFN